MASRSRRLLAATALIAVAVALSACSSGGSSSGKTQLTFVGYGGSGQDGEITAWQKPYTAANPDVTFLNTSPATVAQVQAQVDSGNIQWDVVNVAPYAAEQDCGTIFAKLSTPELNPKDFPAGAIGPCYVGNFTNGAVLGYNTKDFPNPATAPKSLADYFDTKDFPGKRGVQTQLQNGMLEYAELASGVKPSQLYPIDVNKALSKWDTIRSDTLFEPNDGALEQVVASNQVSMFLLDASRFLDLLNQGSPIKPIWQYTVAGPNAFAVPKGDPKLAAAEKFIEAAVQPGPAGEIAELDGVAPVNLLAKPQLSKNAQEVDLYGKENTGTVIMQDVSWYAKNNNSVTTVLNNWLNG